MGEIHQNTEALAITELKTSFSESVLNSNQLEDLVRSSKKQTSSMLTCPETSIGGIKRIGRQRVGIFSYLPVTLRYICLGQQH